MNREIKFRGKRVDNGEWVYGYYVERPAGNFIHNDSNYYAVITSTIGQYTGLKDNNGKEIYEGDIVMDDLGKLYTVEYDADLFSFIADYNDRDNNWMHLNEVDTPIVIGTIYDTKEEKE